MKVKIVTAVSFILLAGVVIFTLLSNSSIKGLEDARDKRFDLYETTKIGVMEDIRAYLSVTDKDSYEKVKTTINMQSEIKSELFGSSYNATKFIGKASISFVDVQYTLEEDGTFIVYSLVNVTKEGVTKEMNFLAFVANNQIYDLLFY